MTALPLMEFGKQGTVCKQTNYIAPFLEMRPGAPLTNMCAPVRRMVREKATALASKLSPNAMNSDLAGLHQVQWLVSCLPAVEALLESDRTHPYSLYLAFCSMAGSVAFLSHARVPPIFPAYDHNDLVASFQGVLDFIRRAMSEGLIEHWQGREFTLSPGRSERHGLEQIFEMAPTLEAAFGPAADFLAPDLGLMVRAPAGVPPESLLEWGESCLLASEDTILYLEESRSRGALCERVNSLDDLVPAPNALLFKVKNEKRWLDPRKKLVLKSAKHETRIPEAVTLFIRERMERET